MGDVIRGLDSTAGPRVRRVTVRATFSTTSSVVATRTIELVVFTADGPTAQGPSSRGSSVTVRLEGEPGAPDYT